MKHYFLICYSICGSATWQPGTPNFTWSFYIYATRMPSIADCKKLALMKAYIPNEFHPVVYDNICINSRQDAGPQYPELSIHQVLLVLDDEETSEI